MDEFVFLKIGDNPNSECCGITKSPDGRYDKVMRNGSKMCIDPKIGKFLMENFVNNK